eukprot:TRINITY_DN10480_c0_g1_i1.p1 TRINITY_DN10480_c0_g1~~TRINITY_DN10480_c0_g1_i1.p1  ORF type:complete len:505 (-),score=89.87 TRINITY_DN10480_c0_g1_i1:14-1453(-)
MDVAAFLNEQMMQAGGGASGFDIASIFDQGSTAAAAGGFATGDAVRDDEVARFFEGHTIQPNAMDTFLSLRPEQQRMVMDAGSLTDARDPTAVLISRCVKAKQGTLQAVQYRPGDWKCVACGEINFARNDTCRKCLQHKDAAAAPLDPAAAEALAVIEGYLGQHNFEERAKETFRSLPPHLMQQVMDAGTFADARDPTAVLVSRINKAKQGTLNQTLMPGDWLCPGCNHHNFSRNTTCRSCGTPNEGGGGSSSAGMAIPQILGGKGSQKRFGESQFSYEQPQAKARRMGDSGGIAAKIQQFFLRMGIQQHAIDHFFTLPPNAQTAVMEAGPLEAARDPTAVLINRMAGAARSYGQPKGQSKGQFSFQAQRAQQGFAPARVNMDPETWLSQYSLEGHAADTFRGLSPEMQQLIMSNGSLTDARDPTAVLVSRINKAKSGLLQPVMTMPGDWNCPQCSEHNFGKNSSCRRCGTSNPAGNMK